MKISAIILIGGTSNRFEDENPKQFHMLSGKEIFLHTLEKFVNLNKKKLLDTIIISCHYKYISFVKEKVKNFPNVLVTQAGETRQLSSYKALLKCNADTDFVIIHDGVRPLVTEEIILKNIQYVKKHMVVDTCISSFDTIVKRDDKGFIENIPNRSYLLRGQTPQSFSYKLILDIHKKALKKKIINSSCDCFLANLFGYKPYIVKGSESNIKITTKIDLFLAEKLLSYQAVDNKKNENCCYINTFKNKIFVIVGGNGDIGKEIKNQLIECHAKVVSLSRTSKIKLDLENEKSIKKAFSKIYEKYGPIDGLINAAGYLHIEKFKKLSSKEIKKQLFINFLGVVYSHKYAILKENGHILNIASSSYYKGRKNYCIYSAAKAALVNFTQGIAEEEPNKKINILLPQRTNTKMRKTNFKNENSSLLLSPKEVAKKALLILQSDLSGTIFDVKKINP